LRSLMGCAYIMRTEIDGRITNQPDFTDGRGLCRREVMELPEPRGRARVRRSGCSGIEDG